MSDLKVNRIQLGQNATATQNFTFKQGADGTMTLARGNAGATTQDLLTIDADGNIQLKGVGVGGDYIKLSDVKASGTSGGTFTSGAWQTRDLNTEDNDDGGHCTLTSNQFTLAAGTYRIEASAPAYAINGHKAILRNISDSSDEIIGTAEKAETTEHAVTRSFVSGEFTITSAKTFEIQHRCTTTKATNGFGVPNTYAVSEVYTVVELWKVK